jgi:hypothetical protein
MSSPTEEGNEGRTHASHSSVLMELIETDFDDFKTDFKSDFARALTKWRALNPDRAYLEPDDLDWTELTDIVRAAVHATRHE